MITQRDRNESALLSPVRDWLLKSAASGDFVLIQGDFGACYLMVRFAFAQGLIPVYATTRREAATTVGRGYAPAFFQRYSLP